MARGSSRWRDTARPIIRKIIADNPQDSERELRRRIGAKIW